METEIKVGDHRIGHFNSGEAVMVITRVEDNRLWYKWLSGSYSNRDTSKEYTQSLDGRFEEIYQPISKEEVIRWKLKRND
jgi:hypothetical protein